MILGGVQKVLCGTMALFLGSAISTLPWRITDALGLSITGAWSAMMLVFVVLLSGFSVAIVYTYFNDGSDALRGLLRRR